MKLSTYFVWITVMSGLLCISSFGTIWYNLFLGILLNSLIYMLFSIVVERNNGA